MKNDIRFYSDGIYPPPLEFEFDTIRRTKRGIFSSINNSLKLSDEFKITLRIFWDDNFAHEFGNKAVDRYIITNCI